MRLVLFFCKLKIIFTLQEPFRQIFHLDAIVIADGQSVGGENDFFVVILNALQWAYFPVECRLGGHICCHLIIGIRALLFSDKIHLGAAELAHIDPIAPAEKLEIDDVLQGEAQVIGPAGQDVVAQPQVHDIILLIGLQELLAHNVKALRRIEDEGFR